MHTLIYYIYIPICAITIYLVIIVCMHISILSLYVIVRWFGLSISPFLGISNAPIYTKHIVYPEQKGINPEFFVGVEISPGSSCEIVLKVLLIVGLSSGIAWDEFWCSWERPVTLVHRTNQITTAAYCCSCLRSGGVGRLFPIYSNY